MSNRKLERALYGPTLFEISLGLVMSVALGALVAIVFLVFKPVEVVKEMPKADEIKDGVVYYLAGSNDYLKAKQWMRKRQHLLEGTPGEVAFTEDDLNLWFSASADGGKAAAEAAAAAAAPAPAKPVLKAQSAAAAAKPAAAAGKPGPAPVKKAGAPTAADQAEVAVAESEEILIPSVLNFRVRDGAVQVGLPTTINLLGWHLPVVAQAKGGFKKQGDMFVYSPDVVMIGSLPLQRFPGATEYLMERAYTSSAIPNDLLAAWRKVNDVKVDGKSLRITIQ